MLRPTARGRRTATLRQLGVSVMIANCAVTGKRCYTKRAAKIALYRILRRPSNHRSLYGVAAYYCDWCGSHHVGHKYHG